MAELKLGNIKPVGADNVVVDGKYVKGGYVVVSDTAERNALKGASGENIVNGSLCYCTGDSKFYQYNGTDWVEAILGDGSATVDLPIQKGSTENSLEIFDNSKSALEGMAGSSNADLITLNDPEASGVSSVAVGGSAKALVAGGQALGILNTVGAKGYYWHTLNVAEKTVTLSTNRPSSADSACTAPTNIDWAEDDIVVMVNDHQYVGLVIESVTGNTVKFSGTLPFSKDNYGSTYPSASDYSPDDRTIVAFYQTSEAGGKVTRWKCRSGSVELGWAGTAFGIANTTVGASSIAAGFNNIQGGDFGIVAGRNNISGYSNIVVGGWNKSIGVHSAVFGRRNTNEGYYNTIVGIDNKIEVGDATSTINSYNMVTGQGNILIRGHRNLITGNNNTNLNIVNNSIISGELHSITGGNNHIVAGKQNTITKKADGSNSNACAVFGLDNTNNGKEYLLIAGRGLTATNDNQCVIGKFNATDFTTLNTSTTMPSSNELTNPALIIGGGSSASATATSCAIGLNGNIRTVGHISAAGSIKTSNAITAGVSIKTDGFIRAEKYIEAKELVKSLANVQANVDVNANNNITAGKDVAATKNVTAGYNVTAGTGHKLAGTTASGNAVFGMENIIGDETTPKAIYGTFMSGKGLKVTGHWQTIIGQFNKYIEKTAFVIGNGDNDNERSNAFSVTTEGNVTAAGKITVGAGPDNDMDVATKSYVDSKAGVDETAVKAILETVLSEGEW